MFNLSPVPVPDLSGKIVLVTGAGRGIGAELLRVLVEHGAKVFAGIHQLGRRGSETLPPETELVDLDVTSQRETDAAIRTIADKAGRLDVLINNAGVIDPIGRLATLSSDDLLPSFAVNVAGVHRMTVAAAPLLRESKGVIINAGTGAATTPMEGWTAYCTSKAAALMLTRMFDLELSGGGIKSFFLGVPPTDTAMQAAIRQSGLNPVSRIAQADLVPVRVPATVMAWLCGPDARLLEEVVLDVRDERFRQMMR
ncbi:SDR family oxidoreductase [Mesorhizobium sp. BH1-1-5]|uniref:SDR family NAD(P)-dependent oxidoreductase n=1 Tax=unclassified Mesorhizobium TaxID=325217 RepID=UPI0015E31CB4|nr:MULTISPECIES: SDR family oxidoreductase [unclassified Mesorhizobium]MBZ9988185.1 SDR family oxidoreductase [Mesorhizobium sp. BH1-1-5]